MVWTPWFACIKLCGVGICHLLGVVTWAVGALLPDRWTGGKSLSDLADLLLLSIAIRCIVTASMGSPGVCRSSGLLWCSVGEPWLALVVCQADRLREM